MKSLLLWHSRGLGTLSPGRHEQHWSCQLLSVDTARTLWQQRGWALTTPFSTQKPSWYLESGRRMTAVVTGGQCTMFSTTSVWCFSSWKMGWGFVRLGRALWLG